jgi:hypothetical protein
VFGKEVGDEVETAGLEVGSSVNGRGRRNEEVDSVGGATEGQRDESGGTGGHRGG